MTPPCRSARYRDPVPLLTRRALALSAVGVTALAACTPRRNEKDDEEDSVTTSEGTCHPAANAPQGESPYGGFRISPDQLVSPEGLAVAPDSSFVAAGLEHTAPGSLSVEDWGTAIWDTASGDLLTVTGNHRRGPLACHPSGDMLAAAGRSQIDILGRDGALQWTLTGHSLGSDEDRRIVDLAFSPDGALLASLSTERTLRLWRFREGACEAGEVIDLGDLMPASLSFSPDGTELAVAGATGPVQIWSVGDVELLRTVEAPEGSPLGVAHLSDGSLVISSYEPAALAVVDPSGAVRPGPSPAAERPYGLSVSPGDVVAVSGDSGSTVTVWDVHGGQHRNLPPARGSAHCVQWAPDGSALYAVSWTFGVLRWDGTQWSLLQMP